MNKITEKGYSGTAKSNLWNTYPNQRSDEEGIPDSCLLCKMHLKVEDGSYICTRKRASITGLDIGCRYFLDAKGRSAVEINNREAAKSRKKL